METYCKYCGRVFKNSDFKLCPYCGNHLSTREGRQSIPRKLRHQVFQEMAIDAENAELPTSKQDFMLTILSQW